MIAGGNGGGSGLRYFLYESFVTVGFDFVVAGFDKK